MESDQSGIDKKSDEEIHQSDPNFSQYPLSDFKKYNTNVKRIESYVHIAILKSLLFHGAIPIYR